MSGYIFVFGFLFWVCLNFRKFVIVSRFVVDDVLFCLFYAVVVIIVVGRATDPPDNQPKKVQKNNRKTKKQTQTFPGIWGIWGERVGNSNAPKNQNKQNHFTEILLCLSHFPYFLIFLLFFFISFFAIDLLPGFLLFECQKPLLHDKNFSTNPCLVFFLCFLTQSFFFIIDFYVIIFPNPL